MTPTVTPPPARRDRPFALEHLRFGGLWLAIGVALVALVVIASLARVPAPVEGVMLHDKAVHLVVYAVLMLWFAQLFPRAPARLLLAVGLALLGAGVEYLQGMTATRLFDRLDMFANCAGVLLAWALSHTVLGRVLPAVERRFARARGV